MNMAFAEFVNKTRLTQPLINFCVIVYMDDILVFSKTHEYHVEHIEWVLHALKHSGFEVALEKSEFFLSEISFLGYIITVDGLKPDPRKAAAVQDAPAPVTLTQVRAFLGLASYYRRFIQGFAGIAKPLTNLLKKEEQLIWTPECEAAFQALKEALTSAPVLARPDPTRQFALYTDWQPQAISAVLTQHGKDGREHVVEYVSKTLSQAQANYEACKGECLAVVWGIQHFRPYLYGQKFVLVTDHQSLLSLRNNTDYAGTLIYETGQRPNAMYHFLVFEAQKRERRPYTETHVVMTGPGPRSVRKRVVRAVADLVPRVLSHVPGAFLYPSFVQHHFHEEDAPTTPVAMAAFLPPIPPPLNPDIDHFL
ncbi:hypothetical protein CBR_g8827 [Chara braunii]|uniref:Reverse transcriptase domain-containing protein n=1 Tax=Chara braunii TaxID=69332 RepID=A0A388KMZ0_CHABU|nr:hypothetical protein CBR_g8827 [Chara braunii]|eukprot:GBG71407.1 hypothetical protein CBR_g8827 [Chara braunii]